MESKKNDRGFRRADFTDSNEVDCSIQESSAAEEPHLWLGVSGTRMHLTRQHVARLMPFLAYFVARGSLPSYDPEPAVPAPPASPVETKAAHVLDEKSYLLGKVAAHREQLRDAIKRVLDDERVMLGKPPEKDAETELARLLSYLHEIRGAVREVCQELEIEFREDAHMADVITKDIGREMGLGT